MADITLDQKKLIKLSRGELSALIQSMQEVLNDTHTMESNRYVSFKTFARLYNDLAEKLASSVSITIDDLKLMDVDNMGTFGNTVWPIQRSYIETTLVLSRFLLHYIDNSSAYAESEVENLFDFFTSRLRAAIYQVPTIERNVQDAVEILLIGRGLEKGEDYDRESGKFEYSGKEYIPDFIIPKLDMCIEVKLIRAGKKSQIIDEINADITAYSKNYSRILFLVYDLGNVRDTAEFKKDIERLENVKVIVIKN